MNNNNNAIKSANKTLIAFGYISILSGFIIAFIIVYSEYRRIVNHATIWGGWRSRGGWEVFEEASSQVAPILIAVIIAGIIFGIILLKVGYSKR